jgi:hypothetical protein
MNSQQVGSNERSTNTLLLWFIQVYKSGMPGISYRSGVICRSGSMYHLAVGTGQAVTKYSALG